MIRKDWTAETAKKDRIKTNKRRISCRVCKFGESVYGDPRCEIKEKTIYAFYGLTAVCCKYFKNKYKED